MEYKIIKNNSDTFWEDLKNKSFGLDKDLVIKLNKNIITIESRGLDAFLERNKKRAKVSKEGQVMKGVVEDHDKLWLSDKVEIEFIDRKKIIIRPPKINWNLWMGILVLLLIICIIFFGWKRTSESNIEKSYQVAVIEIKDKIKKSDEIKSIDTETSLKLLNEAKDRIKDVTDNKKHENEILDLKKNIEEKLATSGSTEVVGFTDTYDTKSADVSDRSYDKMMVVGNEGVLAESKTGKIILGCGLVMEHH